MQTFLVKAGGHTTWIADGSCDDSNNNQFCEFDGGDCCGANAKMQYCYDCLCLGKYSFVSRHIMYCQIDIKVRNNKMTFFF